MLWFNAPISKPQQGQKLISGTVAERATWVAPLARLDDGCFAANLDFS